MRNNDELLDDFDFGDDPLGHGDREQYFQPDDDGVVVGKFYEQLEANISAARLRSEGVPCFITNAFSQGLMPNMQSYVSLHVRREDVERAREILADQAEETAAQTPVEEAPASSFRFENILLLLLAALVFYLAVRSLFGW